MCILYLLYIDPDISLSCNACIAYIYFRSEDIDTEWYNNTLSKLCLCLKARIFEEIAKL